MGNQCLDPKLKERSSQDLELCIRVETWNKEAHNLFDHNSEKLKRQQLLTLSSSALLIKHENTLKVVGSIDFMIDVLRNQHEYRLLGDPLADNGLSLRNLWRVIGKEKTELSQGDIFKLGRLRFLVQELVLEDHAVRMTTNQCTLSVTVEEELLEFHSPCKICYERTYSIENPLISPCSCTGSIEFIHLSCLRQWMEKLSDVKRTESSLSIPCSSHTCQLCHEPIKQEIIVKGVKHSTYHKPVKVQPPYVKLTLFCKDSNQLKGIHYFSFAEKSSTFLGRSSTAGIRVLDDISISRQHSQITFDEGRFYLSDFKSKFGTLLLVRQPIRYRQTAFSAHDLAKYRTLQICNHVLTLELRTTNHQPNIQQLKRSHIEVEMILAETKKEPLEVESIASADESVVQFDLDD